MKIYEARVWRAKASLKSLKYHGFFLFMSLINPPNRRPENWKRYVFFNYFAQCTMKFFSSKSGHLRLLIGRFFFIFSKFFCSIWLFFNLESAQCAAEFGKIIKYWRPNLFILDKSLLNPGHPSPPSPESHYRTLNKSGARFTGLRNLIFFGSVPR